MSLVGAVAAVFELLTGRSIVFGFIGFKHYLAVTSTLALALHIGTTMYDVTNYRLNSVGTTLPEDISKENYLGLDPQ